MNDQQAQSKTEGRASVTYGGKTGMRLEATKYGQMAMSLDYSGCLERIANKQRARAFWLGYKPSEQTDYVDRD